MIESLISSKTRIKLLLKFFLNTGNSSYLRGLESEFGESTNAIRVELNRLEIAGLLQSSNRGNKKIFRANTAHPLYSEIHGILLKYVGIDQIIEKIIERLGEVQAVYLTGDFARGINCDFVDLIFVGSVNRNYLLQLIEKVEPLINRKIRFLTYTDTAQYDQTWSNRKNKPFLIWSDNQSTLNPE